MDISVIIPVYNTEAYLPACIESVMQQGDLCIEIILINDGSTDRSGVIANQYATQNNRIKVIHQENRGASAARNAGLEVAQGEYIAFIDSDDWVKENSLLELYQEVVGHQADAVMGNLWYCHRDGSMNNIYQPVPVEMRQVPLSGKEGFIRLIRSKAYPPMACNYIYNRMFLKKINARFEEGIMYEDELWTPVVLSQAGKMIIVDIDYYYYRQHKGSIMQTANLEKRLNALFRVANNLIEFAGRFDFSGEDGDLKSWMYVNIFKLYYRAFNLLSYIKDTSVVIPEHQLDRFWVDSWEMMPEPQKTGKSYFQAAEAELKKHTDWRMSEWVASVAPQIKAGKKLMLIYNTMHDEDLSLRIEDVPADWVITTDRRYMQEANAVVFFFPDFLYDLEFDLDKPEGQVWIAWYMVSEKKHPWVSELEIKSVFDLWMGYRMDSDVVYPYYRNEYIELLSQRNSINYPQNKVCISVPDRADAGDRTEFLEELMKCIEVDSYSKPHNPIQTPADREVNKLNFYKKYKFVLAFEDVTDQDYVTEKFFDPLIAGSVPIYLGAPNIEDFAPGDNCFVDAGKFENPQLLAQFINAYCEDEQLYAQFFEWKSQPLRESFVKKMKEQKEHPLVRLCSKTNSMTVL
jgi:glycosyltransferase involved in cell wall biosynthesis